MTTNVFILSRVSRLRVLVRRWKFSDGHFTYLRKVSRSPSHWTCCGLVYGPRCLLDASAVARVLVVCCVVLFKNAGTTETPVFYILASLLSLVFKICFDLHCRRLDEKPAWDVLF